MTEEKLQPMGFNLNKEIADTSIEDYFLGGSNKVISGVGDPVAGLVGACYAWSTPIKGVYPRVMHQINHAVNFINEASKDYLPDGTVQRGRQDWMNCATNAPENELEKQFNYALEKNIFSETTVNWFKEKGYINPENGKFEIADGFNSILSGTSRNGNSLKAPILSIYTGEKSGDGIIPKSMMPDTKDMDWNAYHNPARITQEMKDLGQEFKKYVKINFQKVLLYRFPSYTGDIKWDIFDSYKDLVDGDFIKRLASDYNIMGYGYHLTINEIPQPKKEEESKKEEKMVFYKASENEHPERIYQLGADQLFHHIKRQPTFKGLWGEFSDYEIIDMVNIGEGRIGFPIVNEQTIIEMLTNLFKGLGKEK